MIKCPECTKDKPSTDYPNRGPMDRRKFCKPCRAKIRARLSQRGRSDSNRVKVRAHKIMHGCDHCGEKDPVVLQYHHLGDKENGVARMVSTGAAWPKIQSEIEKCLVLCSNCHIREHERLGYTGGYYQRKEH